MRSLAKGHADSLGVVKRDCSYQQTELLLASEMRRSDNSTWGSVSDQSMSRPGPMQMRESIQLENQCFKVTMEFPLHLVEIIKILLVQNRQWDEDTLPSNAY